MARDYVLHTARPSPDLRIDYRKELNLQQFDAVSSPPGPALILAGAGAGKTRTLTYRVAWLIEHGVAPERILLLTFTNRSAREMMSRVGQLLGGDLPDLWGGTFHSIGLRILRRHADRLGFKNGFSVADQEDATEIVAAAITDCGFDTTETLFPKPDVLGEMFSQSCNQLRPLREYIVEERPSMEPIADDIVQVHSRFVARKREAALMDFDDLLTGWIRLLQEHEDLRQVYQRRFQYVLVDEYQDTNKLQGELLDLLSAGTGNLMAVGDDAQSIYGWRGAHFANILKFPERHPRAKVYKIETNYRSTPEILQLANEVISKNLKQFPKVLQPARPSGIKPVLSVMEDGSQQATFVCQRVLELREEGRNLSDICVLYRSHFHAMELQLELTRRNIPFSITSGIRFFEQAHIKDVTAHLRFVANPGDELAFKRMVKLLPGIGGKGAEKLWAEFLLQHSRLEPHDPFATGGESATQSDGRMARVLAELGKKVGKKTAAAWVGFSATVARITAPDLTSRPGEILRLVVQGGYEEYLEANFDNHRNRLDDLEQLAGFADTFNDATEFLSQMALQTNVEAEAAERHDDEDRLKLSTVHQAKGLEFDVVFVIMLCDGLFPNARSLDDSDAEEEERRLFYVAVTRAKDELYLTYPLMRFIGGRGLQTQNASRFLDSIANSPLVDEWNMRPDYGNAWSQGKNTGSAWSSQAADDDGCHASDSDNARHSDEPF